MKRKILLMRHAKSSWADEGLRDFDRPLNKRGEKDAPMMGEYLMGLDILPDSVFSSPAKRAKETALAVCREVEYEVSLIHWNEDLYYGSSMDYLNAIRSAPNDVKTVMTVGHNPMTADAMARLSAGYFNHGVPTATIACLEADIEEWKNLQINTCKLLWIVSPKDL